jgi:hypothetical protein
MRNSCPPGAAGSRTIVSLSVTRWTRGLYGFELEAEVRDWLDSLGDSDYKRVDEVCGLLAEKGTELGGPWSDHLEGPVWNCGSGCAVLRPASHTRLLLMGRIVAADRVPQDPPARAAADRPGSTRAEGL